MAERQRHHGPVPNRFDPHRLLLLSESGLRLDGFECVGPTRRGQELETRVRADLPQLHGLCP